jgi:hypothetical protein
MDSMWMIPFDMEVVQLNMSERAMDILFGHVGCYNSTIETCDGIGGKWRGSDIGVPGTRFGCFSMKDQQCDCSEELCDSSQCNNSSGMLWWTDCLNCQCSTVVDNGIAGETIVGGSDPVDQASSGSGEGSPGGGSTPASSPFPIPSGGGFGCYGVGGTFGACNCSPNLCSPSACAAVDVSEIHLQKLILHSTDVICLPNRPSTLCRAKQ